MIKLLSISFNNIRCFTDSQTVIFENRNKLVQIDGKNNNTGGSSGAGKSTVFMALDYLLGINELSVTVLQSRLTKKTIEASGKFEIDGKLVEISRSKKSGLSIIFPESPELNVTGNVKLAEEKLEDLIGIPKKIFKKMVHKKQKEKGFFLNMAPKEMYDFLINMLGLSKYIEQIDKISEDIRISKQELLSIDFDNLKSNIEDLKSIKSEKKEPTCEVTQEEFEDLENDISSAELALTIPINAMNLEKESLVKPIKQEIPSELEFERKKIEILKSAAIEEHKRKVTTMMNSQSEFKIRLSQINQNKEDLKRVAIEIKKNKEDVDVIKSAVCPTCTKTWEGEMAEDRLEQLGIEGAKLIKTAMNLKKEIDQEDNYKSNLERLIKILETTRNEDVSSKFDEEISKISKEIDQYDNNYLRQINEYNNNIKEIEGKWMPKIQILHEKCEYLKKINAVKSAIYDSYEKELKNYNKEMVRINSIINEKEESLKKIEEKHKKLEKKISVAEESKRLIKSYTLQSFQETLDLIGETATNILSGVPNTRNTTIYFEGCRETKTGALKDEITAMVTTDGYDKVPLKSFCGGEETAIELAVDLAVIDIIETKAGKGADFYIIDEPFDGLDSVCKESYLGVLEQIETNKKIIIVSHSEELKEMVSDVITVVKDGENSCVL